MARWRRYVRRCIELSSYLIQMVLTAQNFGAVCDGAQNGEVASMASGTLTALMAWNAVTNSMNVVYDIHLSPPPPFNPLMGHLHAYFDYPVVYRWSARGKAIRIDEARTAQFAQHKRRLKFYYHRMFVSSDTRLFPLQSDRLKWEIYAVLEA